MVTAEHVISAYRLFLGRDPESDDVVRDKVLAHQTLQSLRSEFLSSAEFTSSYPCSAIDISYWAEPARIDIDVPHDALRVMVERVRKQWTALGKVDPYWSVLTNDVFKSERLNDERLKQFYESGKQSAGLLDVVRTRTGAQIPKGVCFELGCGVGRVTSFLAERFEKVIAADISPGNLAICEEYMRRNGINNVTTMLLKDPADISQMQPVDFFYSVIVLQHNPPPIQKLLLDLIFSRLSENGGCLFQTPEAIPGYTFDAARFLAEPTALMDMHCLPKAAVLDLLRKHALPLRDIAIDNWTGDFGSYTYFAMR